jgi:hypothetical protein
VYAGGRRYDLVLEATEEPKRNIHVKYVNHARQAARSAKEAQLHAHKLKPRK